MGNEKLPLFIGLGGVGRSIKNDITKFLNETSNLPDFVIIDDDNTTPPETDNTK